MNEDSPKPDPSPEEKKKLAAKKRAEYMREYSRVIKGETEEEREARLDLFRTRNGMRKRLKTPIGAEVKAAKVAARKAAQREYEKEYRAKNAQKIKERLSKRYQENREERLAIKRLRREKIRADPVLWEVEKQYHRSFYAAMSEEQKESMKKRKAEYKKWKYKNDQSYKLLTNFRSRANELFNFACRHNKPCKNSFDRYFCCDFEALRAHISSLFRDGMTWENHGKVWHMDHIVPLVLGRGDFELYRKLNHYKNLQPLLVAENRAKGDSIPEIWPEGVPFTREEVMASYEKYLSEKAKAPPKVTKKTKAVSVSQEM